MLIIGEKINIVTKRIAKAIEERDKEPVQEMAKAQVEGGADYLDVNIGPARKSGPEIMKWLVTVIQEAVDVPLSLDTKNVAAIEAGLAVHRGKAIINSTSAVRGSMEAIFPLAAKYNAAVIGLALGERSLPKDTDQRCALAMDVMTGAQEFGLDLGDLYLDPIVVPVNGMQDQSMGVIETIEVFKSLNDPPLKTVVGLSNISNGVPEEMRSILNRTYMALAIHAGLTAAIADPNDEKLMGKLKQVKELDGQFELADVLDEDELKTVEVFRGNILYCHSYLET